MKYVHFLAYQLYLNNTIKISYLQILQFGEKTECKIPYNNQVKKQTKKKPPNNSQIACQDMGKALSAELKARSFSFDTIFPHKLSWYRSNFPCNISPTVLVRIKFCCCK